MAEGGTGRIEVRTTLVGLGMGVTPDTIAELEARARQLEKLDRKPPTEAFSAVMERQAGAHGEAELSTKDRKTQALPKKGPRPALVHPAQRETFGRDEKDTEPVVIKG